MPAPTSYSENDLIGFMEVELGPVGEALGLLETDALQEAVYEVAAILDGAIADVTDMLKLRTIARWQAWVAAEAAATGQYDLKSDGDELKRSQLFAQIQSRLARAESAALRYSEAADALGGGGTAVVSSVSTSGSPYQWATGDEYA